MLGPSCRRPHAKDKAEHKHPESPSTPRVSVARLALAVALALLIHAFMNQSMVYYIMLDYTMLHVVLDNVTRYVL